MTIQHPQKIQPAVPHGDNPLRGPPLRNSLLKDNLLLDILEEDNSPDGRLLVDNLL